MCDLSGMLRFVSATGSITVGLLLGHIVYSPDEESSSPSSRSSNLFHRNASFYGIINPSIDYLNILTRSKPTVPSPDQISNNECGVTSYYTDNINSQIANGEETLPGQWPWLVALFILIPDELVNRFQCSGSILTTKHIITGMLRDRRKKFDITNILRVSNNASYLRCFLSWSTRNLFVSFYVYIIKYDFINFYRYSQLIWI